MGNTQVLDVMYQTFQLVLKLALPFLLVSVIVGVTIAIFQAATQINKQIMGFVPKLLSISAMMGVLGNSMLALLRDFTRRILSMIAGGQFCMFILFSLIIIRMSGTIALNPVFGRMNIPPRVKAAFILVISLMLYIGPGGILVHELAVMAEYGVMLVEGLLFGFTLGFSTELAFLAVRFVSAIMGYSVGLTMTQVYDPQHNAQMTITTGIYYAFVVMLFLATNGHLRLLTIFFMSCGLIPFGTVAFGPKLAQTILLMFQESIAMRLQSAFPLITMKLVAETAMGVLMWTIPQINISIVNSQIKTIADIFMLLFLFSPMSDKLYIILNGMYQSLQQIMTLVRQGAGRE